MEKKVDMNKLNERVDFYKSLNHGLEFDVKVYDHELFKCAEVSWLISAFDPLSFYNKEYCLGGGVFTTTDEAMEKFVSDVEYFLSKEEVKFIISQNRRAEGELTWR